MLSIRQTYLSISLSVVHIKTQCQIIYKQKHLANLTNAQNCSM